MAGTTDLPLSARGRLEAELIADRLAGWHAENVVYASPLSRALDTAAAICRRRGGSVRVLDGLCEIDCGTADGLPLAEVWTRYPDAWQQNLRQDDPAFRWPGGESYAEFRERCVSAICAIAARHRRAPVIVVTHAGVISQVLGHIHGESAACWSRFRPENASVTEVNWEEDAGSVARFDDRLQT